MKSTVTAISGNAFTIQLTAESDEERERLINQLRPDDIEAYFQIALRQHFGVHVKPASLTPNADYPFSATVELLAEKGSI